MKKTDPPIIVQETFDRSVQEVWKAISELEQMKIWYFENIPAFEAEVGFETQFPVHNEGRTFTHTWKVIEVSPNQKLTYTWSYPEYEGDATVSFELEEKGGKTTLTLTMIVLETFPQDIQEFKRESCTGGWNYFISERLKAYLS